MSVVFAAKSFANRTLFMILDVIKLVAETPSKALKLVINSSRLLFALVLSVFFYRLIFGPWHSGQASEWELWRDWIATGRVLFSAFFFVVAYFLLFSLFPVITKLPVVVFQRRYPIKLSRDKDFGLAIKKVLLQFKFIQADANGRVHATRHTEELIELVKHFEETDAETDLSVEDDMDESSSFLDLSYQMPFSFISSILLNKAFFASVIFG
jgi:hypothetical protein